MALLTQLTGAGALVVTATSAIPQTVRIVRVRSTAGVSAAWAVLGAVSTAAWTVYAISQELWWTAIADALACAGYTAILWVLNSHGSRPNPAIAAGWTAVFVLAYATAGFGGFGAVLAVAFVIQVTPSLWTAYREPNPVGSSITTWYLGMTDGVLWAAYGTLEHDGPVALYGLIALTSGVLMVTRLKYTARDRNSTRRPRCETSAPRSRFG